MLRLIMGPPPEAKNSYTFDSNRLYVLRDTRPHPHRRRRVDLKEPPPAKIPQPKTPFDQTFQSAHGRVS